jgi:C1A family cysteine protease
MDVYRPETMRGGHAVALVGYTPDRFIVRNSWGTTGWGDQGFGYASLAYAQQAFTEAYGVSL